ncbi:MAG: hypothetical protein CUN56_00020 [Phototrophicales bacterium]|nr:MAG: hypothetical protein CUN56_00020 [Phototrophicales bacterium]
MIHLIHQDSGDRDWHTPKKVVDLARDLMGVIDFDPASSSEANVIVGAASFVSKPDQVFMVNHPYDKMPVYNQIDEMVMPYDLHQIARGCMWVNHPFSRRERPCDLNKCTKAVCRRRGYHVAYDVAGNKEWIKAVVSAYETGLVTAVCGVCFAAVSAAWFRPLLEYPLGIFYGRLNYQKGGLSVPGVTKDSVFYYLGNDVDRFVKLFETVYRFGKVKV